MTRKRLCFNDLYVGLTGTYYNRRVKYLIGEDLSTTITPGALYHFEIINIAPYNTTLKLSLINKDGSLSESYNWSINNIDLYGSEHLYV